MADRKPHLLGCSAPPHSFNKQQMLVLSSICDTLIPSIVPFASLSSNERGNSGNSTGKVGSNEGPVLVHPPAWAPGDSEDGKKDRQVATLAELDEFFALSGSENGTPEEAAGLFLSDSSWKRIAYSIIKDVYGTSKITLSIHLRTFNSALVTAR